MCTEEALPEFVWGGGNAVEALLPLGALRNGGAGIIQPVVARRVMVARQVVVAQQVGMAR